MIIFHDAGDWGGEDLSSLGGTRSEPAEAFRPQKTLPPSSHFPASSSTATEAPGAPPPAPPTTRPTVTQPPSVLEAPPSPPLRLQPVPSDPIPDRSISEHSDDPSMSSSPVEAGFSLWRDLLHTALTDPLMITGE